MLIDLLTIMKVHNKKFALFFLRFLQAFHFPNNHSIIKSLFSYHGHYTQHFNFGLIIQYLILHNMYLSIVREAEIKNSFLNVQPSVLLVPSH